MIIENVIRRTFKIRYKGRAGTCFTITVENEKYLITASHIVEEIAKDDVIQIYQNSEWIDLRVDLIGHTPKLVDISVLSADLSFSDDCLMLANSKDLVYGQDVYFLGFPNVLDVDNFATQASFLEIEQDVNFPIPMVKRATFSNIDLKGTFLIDGYANPGFSGGPMVYKPYDSNNSGCHVAGVITKDISEIIPVYQTELQAKNDGGGIPPIGYFKRRSGNIIASNITHAIDLIKNNYE